MQRGILWAMSLVLKFCFSVAVVRQADCSLCGSAISSAVTRYGPIGREGVARLHLVEGVAGGQQPAGRAVDEVAVAEDVLHGPRGRHRGGALADDQRDLGLALEDGGGHVGQHHGVAVADDRAGRLDEGVDRGRLAAGAVLHVVHRHAHDVGGLGQRRPDPHLADRCALPRATASPASAVVAASIRPPIRSARPGAAYPARRPSRRRRRRPSARPA